jgi:tetratricopeptide (TPR) repeat protein
LRVVSRTTAMHYKGVRRPLPEIARELGVDAIVEGTVVRSGERVLISAQLIEAQSDTHLWAESYERDTRDVLMLQSEVARAIVREIRVKLPAQEQAQLMRSRVVDPTAYEHYLRGRYHWNKRSIEGIRKGVECFQHAIEIDPTYAPAYSGLADSAGILGWWCFVSPEEGCRRGKAAALQALAIDHELAEAHASLGWNLLHYDYDFTSAESEFQRALELGPRNPTAVQWHAICLTYTARLKDAVDEILKAAQLDPLSPIITTTAGMILRQARQYDQGLEMCRKALDLAPEFSLARWLEAGLLSQMGIHDKAIAEMEGLVQASRELPLFVAQLGNCCAMAGKRKEALRVVQQLGEISKTRFISAFWPASIYACLNEIDRAFHWLEKAYQERSPWMAAIKCELVFDHLRSDPRFEALLRRMNFPP